MFAKNENIKHKILTRFLYLSLLFGFLIVGCSENSEILTSINDSLDETNSSGLFKSNEIVIGSLEIDGTTGGTISVSRDVVDPTGRIINIFAELIVPMGAYEGIKTISMEVDWETASVDFNPSMVFDTALTFNFMITNLPLAQMGFEYGDTVRFMYIDPNGDLHPVLSKDVAMNYYWGRLRVHNAKIEHFSRYAFIRKSEKQLQTEYKCIRTN